jgi:DNA-binding beta-propeller fold protein YncE
VAKTARKLALAVAFATLLVVPAAAQGDFTPVRSFGTEGSGPGQFMLPLGVAVARDGTAYVADTFNNRIQVFGSSGEHQGSLGTEGAGPGQFNTPFAVAVDRRGRLFVADTGNRRVQRIDPSTGEAELVFGEGGSGPGELAFPTGLAVDGDGDVLVVDRDNAVLQRYDSDGTLVAEWGGGGSGPGEFSAPLDVAIGEGEDVFVADAANNRVQRLAPDGSFQLEWSGGLFMPQGLIADDSGRVFVADSGNDRVRFFDPVGTLLGEWGTPGQAEGEFDLPRGISIDCGGFVYVTDVLNSRIQVFADPDLDIKPGGCVLDIDELIVLASQLDLGGNSEQTLVAKLRFAGRRLASGEEDAACLPLRLVDEDLERRSRRRPSEEIDSLREELGFLAEDVGCEG